ncbi:hypothetical protein H5410_038726 [Solanum commersonii]|uniref:Uncharacterized protein n=1 Tax=Solanum commersonii TaxID=4109 RepID=A0A9J5YEQ6_SOLCO|nr:hypothetical protein H5410_038726 [Solanum commersonii]
MDLSVIILIFFSFVFPFLLFLCGIYCIEKQNKEEGADVEIGASTNHSGDGGLKDGNMIVLAVAGGAAAATVVNSNSGGCGAAAAGTSTTADAGTYQGCCCGDDGGDGGGCGG